MEIILLSVSASILEMARFGPPYFGQLIRVLSSACGPMLKMACKKECKKMKIRAIKILNHPSLLSDDQLLLELLVEIPRRVLKKKLSAVRRITRNTHPILVHKERNFDAKRTFSF